MKLGIIIGIIVGVIIAAVAAVAIVFLLVLPASRQVVSVASTTVAPVTSTPAVVASNPPITVLPSSTPLPLSTPTSTAQNGVNFAFNVGPVSISGLTSVNVSASITDTGTEEAHNVVVTLEVLYQGSPVNVSISGQPAQPKLTVPIGNISPGQTINKSLQVSFSLIDGLNIARNGATINATITSLEKTETLSYNYKP